MASALSRLVGQHRVRRLLTAMLSEHHLPPLLFVGRQGTGKRTAALLLAQTVACRGGSGCGECHECRAIGSLRHPDVKLVFPVKSARREGGREADIADYVEELADHYPEYTLGAVQPAPDPRHSISVHLARWIRTEASRLPAYLPLRFLVVLHAHRMTQEAVATLLKTLEEPHERCCFILVTDCPSALPDTIRSRCRSVRFADVSDHEIESWLADNAPASDAESRRTAVAAAQGAPGMAYRLLSEGLDSAGGLDRLLDGIRAIEATPARDPVDRHVVRAVEGTSRSVMLETLATAYRARLKDVLIHGAGGRATEVKRWLTVLGVLLSRMDDGRLSTNAELTAYTLLSRIRRALRS